MKTETTPATATKTTYHHLQQLEDGSYAIARLASASPGAAILQVAFFGDFGAALAAIALLEKSANAHTIAGRPTRREIKFSDTIQTTN